MVPGIFEDDFSSFDAVIPKKIACETLGAAVATHAFFATHFSQSSADDSAQAPARMAAHVLAAEGPANRRLQRHRRPNTRLFLTDSAGQTSEEG